MADKSPHDAHHAKKSGKALKLKRQARKTQAETSSQVDRLLHPRKQQGTSHS
jgi:hypothetical protein